MPPHSLSDRVALADKLRTLKPVIAESVTANFFERHPDWVTRYGERGRKLGIEDACFHMDFLAGAIEAGSVKPFEDYVRWTCRMLGARNIAAHFVAENLKQIEVTLASFVTSDEAAAVADFTNAGCLACVASPEDILDETGENGKGTAEPSTALPQRIG